ncbi:short chain dehydrogenase/reductase family [Talaromyces stipitatus ATCC 10500]|uniref:Short chain dehydrogenase/reductase family n=1 Tax=Talaromyces stipitatus (strain ATCC 10500 / CBS 375.48 / QM 6759 / NRRL 1006) TaxID=441959 RepID=B8MDE7_TALSN|nr:short chain dehydrogenase/reductase family [Talaromyces stipitatus ATCC 10500]EED17910.1 short chain dehydrogenase/reductase family [Talaromyces stipitatus ATCC 10500]
MSHLDASKLFSLNGLVAVVTGGGSGLGRTMALALAQNGASKVFIIGRRADALNETASLSPRLGVIIPVIGDIGSKESLENAYKTVSSQTEYIDLLIANSGIIGPANARNVTEDGETVPLEKYRESLWSIDPKEMTHTFHVNATGAHFTVVAFLPLLDAANKRRPPQVPNSGILSPPRPQIIITSSIAGFMREIVSGFAYQASKAAVNSLIKMWSNNLLNYQIRVNGIAPGIYPSEMTTGRLREFGTQHGVTEGDAPKTAVPLTRLGSEQDIAGLVLFMAGASGGYLNGTIVISDGGRLASKPSSY